MPTIQKSTENDLMNSSPTSNNYHFFFFASCFLLYHFPKHCTNIIAAQLEIKDRIFQNRNFFVIQKKVKVCTMVTFYIVIFLHLLAGVLCKAEAFLLTRAYLVTLKYNFCRKGKINIHIFPVNDSCSK